MPLPAPSIERLRIVTLPPVLTIIPLVLALRTDPNVPPQSIVMALVMVTAPNPPGSMQLISPPVAVFEIAPAKVLHGAVRLHGLASSPTPETQVRVAWAWAEVARSSAVLAATRIFHMNDFTGTSTFRPTERSTRAKCATELGQKA